MSKLPEWFKSIPDYTVSQKDGHFILALKEHPEMFLSFDDDQKKFIKEFKKFDAKATRYKNETDSLKTTYGITIRREGTELVFGDNDSPYSYSFPLTLDPEISLSKARGKFEKAANASRKMLQKLKDTGLSTEISPADSHSGDEMQRLSVTSEHLPSPVTVVMHGPKQLIKEEDLIKLAGARSYHIQGEEKKKSLIALPADQQVSIVLDAGAISKLLHVRDGDDHDLSRTLRLLAKYPTVKAIYIPAHIADFELRGSVRKALPDGTSSLEIVDPLFARNSGRAYDRGRRDYLLSKASRIQIEPDGSKKLVKNEYSKIIIVESPFDRALAGAIQEFLDTKPTRQQINDFFEQARNDVNVLKHRGEAQMTELASGITDATSVYLITADTHFIRERDRHVTTRMGKPIGTATPAVMLDALCKSYKGGLGEELGRHFSWNRPISETDLERIIGEMYEGEDHISRMARRSEPGLVPTPDGMWIPQKNNTLESYIHRGAELMLPQPSGTFAEMVKNRRKPPASQSVGL